MIYALLQQLQALGLNVPDLLAQLGTTNGEQAVKVPTANPTVTKSEER